MKTEYDSMGRVESRTNPYPANGSPSYETSYEYDVLGRATETTLPDGDTIETSYDGDEVTITDQVNRKIRRASDGLGRLVKVTEQNASGTLSQETDYSYDLLDRLVEVDQGGQLRKYKYDGLGRLLYEKIPEQTATINDGTGTYWTTKLTYTDFDAVETKTDARGVVTTYEYDELNRLETVSYNTSGATGVATTPGVSYEYGTEGEETGQLMSVEVGTLSSGGYKLEYIYDVYGRVSSVKRWFSATQSYTTSYQMNEANQRKQLTYPSSRVENYGYDSKGRLATAGEVNSISYNIAGQMTSWRIGDDDDNITESYSYDADRLQMTNQTVERTVTECYFQPSPPAVICDPVTTTLMDVDYDYEAAAGETGASTTAGNAGQLMGLSGVIDSQSESAAYTYDNVGRLVTSTQTTSGASAQRRFAYDRWGNRTGVWNAVTGGTQIQSVALLESSSIPTNQIESVTENSATSDYTYDAAGNVTDDDVNTFVYDAENRLVSVNSGAEQYKYDHQNRRVAKTVGSVTTQYVWEGSKVIAEHAASSGNVLVDYIFMGSRMVKKVEGSATRYIVSDRLSARMMLDEDYDVVGKQSHLPFGEAMATSGEQEKHKFTSYERDTSTGLDYAVNRWHSAGVGRFLQADPYRASGGRAIPQSWNRYSYVHNDPINKADPLGLRFVCMGIPIMNGGEGTDLEELVCSPISGVGGGSGESEVPSEGPPITHDLCMRVLLEGIIAKVGSGQAAIPTIAQFFAAKSAAEASGADISLVLTTWWMENKFVRNPRNNLSGPAYGPLQLQPNTASQFIQDSGYSLDQVIGDRNSRRFTGDIDANLTVGGNFLAWLTDQVGGDLALAGAAYLGQNAVIGKTPDELRGAYRRRYNLYKDLLPSFKWFADCMDEASRRLEGL